MSETVKVYNRRLIVTLFLAFSSGLPLALTGSTLQAWYTESGVNLMTIGILSLAGLPYIWKFLWSPLMDRFTPPVLGRRRGWILVTQLGLCATLFIMANMNPAATPKLMGVLALIIAFFSASQDIAVDAYRVDILHAPERGYGAAYTVLAYRIAMLVSGGLALVLADHIGWRLTYEWITVLIALSAIATYLGPESTKTIEAPKTFRESVIDPFLNLLQKDKIVLILLFIVMYKIGDALAFSLMSNFLLHGLGFSLTQVGLAYKTVGFIATIAGAFLGGAILSRINLYYGLLYFGLAQAFSTLFFMLLAITGKNIPMMFSAITIESFCSGMSTAALMAFMMSLCLERYSATQYASLTALMAVGRVFLGPVAALMVLHIGWPHFFFWSFMLSFPGLILLSVMRSRVNFNAEVVKA